MLLFFRLNLLIFFGMPKERWVSLISGGGTTMEAMAKAKAIARYPKG